MRFDLTDLRVFLEVCQTGSMTAAAERAHLTLAAVSARVRRMEDLAGVRLLHRHPRGVAPTRAGRVLARHAHAVWQRLAALQAELADTADTASPAEPGGGRLVLLVNSSARARPWADILAAALAALPGVSIVMHESPSEVTLEALRGHGADLGIVSSAAPLSGLVSGLLSPDPLVALLPPAHPLAATPGLAFGDLLRHDWIVWGAGSALHVHLQMQAERLGAPIRMRAGVSSCRDVARLVGRGAGVSVLPAALVEDGAPAGLVVRRLSEPWADRHLMLCHAAHAASPPAQTLARMIGTHWPVAAGCTTASLPGPTHPHTA